METVTENKIKTVYQYLDLAYIFFVVICLYISCDKKESWRQYTGCTMLIHFPLCSGSSSKNYNLPNPKDISEELGLIKFLYLCCLWFFFPPQFSGQNFLNTFLFTLDFKLKGLLGILNINTKSIYKYLFTYQHTIG